MRNTQPLWIQILLIGFGLHASVSGESTFPLLSNCFEDAEKISEVSAADSVKIRYASAAGGTKPCYAVQVTKDGRSLSGFLVAASLPAIDRFEADVRTHVPQIPPPTQPVARPNSGGPAADPESEPPGPTSLAGLKGADLYGRSIKLSTIAASHVVVYFWSAMDKKSTQITEGMGYIHEQFAGSPNKLEIVGVATARNVDQVRQVCLQNEVTWTQIYDRDQLANRYHVRSEKPYILLDRSRKVIAAVATPQQLEIELRRVGLK